LLRGNESVAQIMPNTHGGKRCWLIAIWKLPDYGFHAVDFRKLPDAKAPLMLWCQAVSECGDAAEIAEFWAQARANGYAHP
jgi:hypothetical protein